MDSDTASNADSIPRVILFSNAFRTSQLNVFIQIELINHGTKRRSIVWALATRIREIPGYTLSPEPGDSNTFSWRSSIYPGKFRDSTLK